MVRSDWLIFGRDFTVRTITMETVRFVYFFSLPGNSKPHETQKVKTNALKSLLKAKYSFKKLLFLRFFFSRTTWKTTNNTHTRQMSFIIQTNLTWMRRASRY